jgi:hypothetical protein
MQANSIIQGGKLTQLVDPYLPTEGHTDEVEKMTLAAFLVHQTSTSEPSSNGCCKFSSYLANLQLLMRFIFLVLQASGCNHQVLRLLEGDNEVLKWARSEAGLSCESFGDECVMTPPAAGSNTNIQSYINLAFDVEDDAASVSSNDLITANTSLEEYLRERWAGHLALIDVSIIHAELPL